MTHHIGIDVAKERLDVAVHESGETFHCRNEVGAQADPARWPAVLRCEELASVQNLARR